MAEKTVSYDAVLGAIKVQQTAVRNNFISDDEYSVRLQSVLRSICRPDYPAGLIPWLGEQHPDMYFTLTEKLPEEMRRLWTEHRPIDEFDKVLGLWVDAHKTACGLYLASGDAKQAILRNGGSDK